MTAPGHAGEVTVVGIGQATAGDDGVGLLVARELAARGLRAVESTDASALLTLLEEGRAVVVVDAVLGGGEAGDVVRLDLSALASGPQPLSSHGVGVAQALQLAGVLYGHGCLAGVCVVGVVVARPSAQSIGLSPVVAGAVARAADLAEALAARLAAGAGL